MMKRTRSSATTPSARARRNRPSAARQGRTPAVPVPEDADAQRALAWLERGKPRSELVPDEAVPAQSKVDLEKCRPASYRRSHSR